VLVPADDVSGRPSGIASGGPGSARPARAKERIAMPEQDAKARAANFDEVALGYDEEMAFEEAGRCLQCNDPTCIEGCPVNIDIKEFIRLLREGDKEAAAMKIRERNSLPAVCGRVCPQEDQCEIACVLHKKGKPIAIGRLERFLGDWALSPEGTCPTPVLPPQTGKRVAVVGSGPAGLTCAGVLARKGHEVTVFEALHKPGGVLVYGIPEFRLPKRVVADEVCYLESLGVTIRTDAVIGRLFTVDELVDEEGYDAAFVGVGAGAPVFLGIPGEHNNGVFSANEFLTRANLMRAYEFPKTDTPIIKGERVAVIGGGNVAMDSARTALRLGAHAVFLVYRRSEDEMPARLEELHHAKQEGIEFVTLTNPIEITGSDGWVDGMICQKMELGEPDESGRRRPVTIEGSEFKITCDVVIEAIGTMANALVPSTTRDLELSSRGYVKADEGTGATSRPGLFAGGDIVTGSATVILAMGAGRKAARAMDAYLAAL
jgi:glutamate synthase (NADPH/NADH) small chain